MKKEDDHYPPPHVMAEWRKHCDCCPVCCGTPCDGVMAGGFCDQEECKCSGGYDDDDDF